MAIPRATLFGLTVLACSPSPSASSIPGPSAPATVPGELRVANGTAEPFAFFATASDLMPLLDPVPEVDLNSADITVVPPGQERLVGEFTGPREAPDGGVAVFLYKLTADGRRARFTTVELVSGEAIRGAGGRILIYGF